MASLHFNSHHSKCLRVSPASAHRLSAIYIIPSLWQHSAALVIHVYLAELPDSANALAEHTFYEYQRLVQKEAEPELIIQLPNRLEDQVDFPPPIIESEDARTQKDVEVSVTVAFAIEQPKCGLFFQGKYVCTDNQVSYCYCKLNGQLMPVMPCCLLVCSFRIFLSHLGLQSCKPSTYTCLGMLKHSFETRQRTHAVPAAHLLPCPQLAWRVCPGNQAYLWLMHDSGHDAVLCQ